MMEARPPCRNGLPCTFRVQMTERIIDLERSRIELLNRKIARDLAAFGLGRDRALVLAGIAVAAIKEARPEHSGRRGSWPAGRPVRT